MSGRGALLCLIAGAAGVLSALAPSHADAGALRTVLVWPGPGPQLRSRGTEPSRVVDWNRGCEHCHQEIAAEWRTSRHHAAYTNESFQAALAREPDSTRAFCIRCHAPESQARLGADEAAALGVGCVTCHVPLGPVLAVERTPGSRAPHATVATRSFRSADACKGCHEFELPRHHAGGLMQRTVSEHRESGSEVACSGCHMPSRDGHRGHSFPGGYDEALVRSSLTIEAARAGTRARISIATRNVTHAVPTGDLFRRLAVEITPVAADGARLAPIRRFLGRHYAVVGGERVETSDDRPHLAPRLVELDLAGTSAAGFDWSVRYERVGFHPSADEAAAEVESAFEIASGTVR